MTAWLLAFLALHFAWPITASYALTHLLVAAGCMVLVVPVRKYGWTAPSCLFVIWLTMTAVAGFWQPHWYWHLWGNYLRYEGTVTWVLLTLMALAYWRLANRTTWLEVAVALILAIQTALILWFGRDIAKWYVGETPIAVAAFAAMGAVLLYASHPALALLAAVPLWWGNTRASVAAIAAGLLVFHAVVHWRKPSRKVVLMALVILTCLTIPVATKLMSTNIRWTGPRTQWVLQGAAIASGLPLAGHGFDTQLDYLKNPKGSLSESVARKDAVFKADRCHNIIFDIILQSGWLGYVLLLFTAGAAIYCTVKSPTGQNAALLAVMAAYAVFNMLNPSGIPSAGLALIALFGLREQRAPAEILLLPPAHPCPRETSSPLSWHPPAQP
jgi:hypothetical protein